jgi:glycosyltransferase involved in cell wall biosynthesis
MRAIFWNDERGLMRVLFLMPAEPLTENYSGAASRHFQNLIALRRAGAEVIVARIDTQAHFGTLRENGADDAWRASAPTDAVFDFPYQPPPLSRLARWVGGIVEPVGVVYNGLEQAAARIDALLTEFDPDTVWVESSALGAAVMLANPAVGWALSHLDVLYRVRALRHGVDLASVGTGRGMSVRAILHNRSHGWQIDVLRRAETTVIQAAPVIITASATDAERLREMGAADVRVIPMGYDALPIVEPVMAAHETPRVVHLGSMETTANRMGLEAYLRKAHPYLDSITLTLIGNASTLKPPLKDMIVGDARVVLAGYQPDLNTALRACDIAILPYEHDTGYRTKLPLLMRYRQVIVTTRAAVAGSLIPGLSDVIVITERLEDFPDAIRRLWHDSAERARLGSAAQAFFAAHYTHEAIQPLYAALLKDVT